MAFIRIRPNIDLLVARIGRCSYATGSLISASGCGSIQFQGSRDHFERRFEGKLPKIVFYRGHESDKFPLVNNLLKVLGSGMLSLSLAVCLPLSAGARETSAGTPIRSDLSEAAKDSARIYELWEAEPAPNRGADYNEIKSRGYPYDHDWEYWSYPLGNGYIGANWFGRTDTERIQITDKTLHVEGPYDGRGGLSNFAELYLDFGHVEVENYRRALNLNTATGVVSYDSGGVHYTREYFTSYTLSLTKEKP